MKYSRAALRRGAPRPQNAEARGRQARASADKADPRRDIGGQKSPSPRHGGQGRPAPRSAAAAPARPHAYYISPFTLCQAPFFGFISRALPDLLRPFMAFPCPFAAFFAPFCRAAGAAAGGQNGCDGAGAAPPAGRRRKDGTAPARPFPDKSRAAARTGCRLVLYPLYSEAGPCAPRRALPRPVCLAPRQRGARTAFQSKPGKNRGGAERAAQSGTRQRGKNAAARRSDAVSPPLLPQSAGAQTRRAGAYT